MLFYGNPAPDAELVVMYGNCQIPFLASLLAAAHGDVTPQAVDTKDLPPLGEEKKA